MSWGPAYERIAALVCEHTGLSFPAERRDRLVVVVPEQMRSLAESDADRYYLRLQRDESALDELAAEITIGETYFFRDTSQFTLIRERILPEIAARRDDETIRVWSAGCATGEEAYSLAIAMRELGLAERAHIIGTDIARSRLLRASIGRFGAWSLRGVPDAVTDSYFTRRGKRYELKREIRALAEFRYLNLAEDTYPALSTGIWGFDLILCRNVLIYLQPAIVARVLRGLVASLAEGGWLLLGASDPTHEVLRACEVITTAAGLAYRKSGARAAIAPAAIKRATPRKVSVPARVAPRPQRTRTNGSASAARVEALGIWLERVRTLANEGDLAQAERTCLAALEQHPADADLLYLHATLLSERGHHDAAVRAARQALYLEPDLVVAHLALGNACARAGNRASARRAFENAERLLTRMPADADVRGAEGEPAGRLLSMTRVQLKFAGGESSA